MWRKALLRWLLLWLVVSAIPLLLLRAADALPCALPTVDASALRAVATRWRRPAPRPTARPWWASLAPRNVSWRLRDGQQDGTGWYLSPTTGTSSQRGLVGATRGWSVGLRWDLGGLFMPQLPSSPGATLQTERVERLLTRLAVHLRVLAGLHRRALDVTAQTPQCRDLRNLATAPALVVEGVSGATAGAVRWPSTASFGQLSGGRPAPRFGAPPPLSPRRRP